MNEQRLRELMSESVEGIDASDSLRAKVSAAVGGTRHRRRTTVRGWIAVGGAGLAAAAVLLAVPLIRTPSSAPGPATGATSAGATPVDDAEDVLGGDTWYGIGIVAHGKSLALSTPARAEDAMSIKLTGNGLNGYDGCHWFNAGRAVLESAPSNTVAITMSANACEPDPVGWKEFYAALDSGPKSWAVNNGLLILDASGIEVTFSKDWTARPLGSSTPQASQQDVVALLGSKTWYVARIRANGSPVRFTPPSDPDRAMSIKVDGNSLTGFDGCNWIGATTAALSSASATRVEWSSTDVGCTPIPSGQAQFLAALRTSDKVWTAREGTVILRAGNYEIGFDSTPPAPASATASATRLSSVQDVIGLFGSKSWYVTKILAGGEPVEAPAGDLWLRILNETVTVHTSCNDLEASARALMSAGTAQYLWSTTMVGCEAGPGRAESVTALQAHEKSWFVGDDTIILRAAAYEITFSSKAPAPSAATSATG